mgnify:CR=1 FL=1
MLFARIEAITMMRGGIAGHCRAPFRGCPETLPGARVPGGIAEGALARRMEP